MAETVVLLAGPEPVFAGIGDLLTRQGIQVATAGDAAAARAIAKVMSPRIAVLHADLDPVATFGPGFACLKTAHIILLVEKASAADRIAALEAGADGVLEMPVAPRELVARLRALFRRQPRPRSAAAQAVQMKAPEAVEFGGFRFEAAAGRLRGPDGREIALGGRERALLSALVERPRRLLTRRQLADLIGLDGGETDERRIEDSVGRLRRLLQAEGQPPLIVTVSGEGYRFDPPASSQARNAVG